MAARLLEMAIAYDFDGTLAPGNMQEHSFIPGLGMKKEQFWTEAKAMAKHEDMDEILAYMFVMLERSRDRWPITKKSFKQHGRTIRFFPGVASWFGRHNAYAKQKGIRLKHYIISSGLREMINGTPIAKEFEHVFASGFAYDKNDVAHWPALAVNYTNKTQYLFRINKGINNSFDNTRINAFVPNNLRPIPFSNMVYIGDGETDVPCMKMLKHQGGYSIAVYGSSRAKSVGRPSAKQTALRLIEEKRADYAVPADYTRDSKLDHLIKGVIDAIAVQGRLAKTSRAGSKVN
jgi:haloacid dehalogenase-like hydrolase